MTALITGTNRGIGLELCRLLCQRKEEVIAVCREASDELKELPVQIEEGVDLTSADHLAALARGLQGRSLDLLIHNAGLLMGGGIANVDLEDVRKQFEVNAFAPLALTSAL